jgi:hypothetical protein
VSKKDSLGIRLFHGAALTAAGLMFCAMGCAREAYHPQLTLQSLQGHAFTQQFCQAYVSHDKDGDTDLVLLDQACEDHLDATKRHGRENAPVRQVMHLRVLWNPKRDQKMEHLSGSNATVHWYVMGNTPETAADIIEYAGTAYVVTDDSGEQLEFTIRNASISPVACRGSLVDPIGTSTLSGTVRALDSHKRVCDALTAVRIVVAASNCLPGKGGSKVNPEMPSSMAR